MIWYHAPSFCHNGLRHSPFNYHHSRIFYYIRFPLRLHLIDDLTDSSQHHHINIIANKNTHQKTPTETDDNPRVDDETGVCWRYASNVDWHKVVRLGSNRWPRPTRKVRKSNQTHFAGSTIISCIWLAPYIFVYVYLSTYLLSFCSISVLLV